MNRRLIHWPALVFLGMVAVLATHAIYDPDFWYHLAVGQRILRTGQVLHTNWFSFTHPEHRWIDVYWLYESLLAALWRYDGSLLVVALKVVLNLALAALVLFAGRDRRSPLTGLETGLLLLAWLVMLPRLSDRPEILSYVLLAAMLALIRRGRLGWCIPLQIVWANVHTLFYLGPVLLLVQAACNRKTWRTALLVAVAAVAASCVSPFGWNNLLVARELWQTMRVLGNQVEEFPSPFHPAVWSGSGNPLLFLLWVVLGGLVVLRSPSVLTPYDGAILLLSLGLAVRSQRAVPLAVLCSLPIVLAGARRLTLRAEPTVRWAVVGLMAVMTVDFVAGTNRLVRSPRGDLEFGVRVHWESFPDAVVESLRQLPRSARVANVHFHTGGFLMWALGDEDHRVFIDPRLEAYPREFVAEYSASVRSAAAFREFADRFDVTHALIVKDQPEARQLARQLAQDPGWRRVYTDPQAEVFQRTS